MYLNNFIVNKNLLGDDVRSVCMRLSSLILYIRKCKFLSERTYYYKITVFFVYDHLQKRLSTTFDNCFHKITDHHCHNRRGEKINLPITKSSTYALQSITSCSIRDWNSLNSKTNIVIVSP